jgi:hypothetical protein
MSSNPTFGFPSRAIGCRLAHRSAWQKKSAKTPPSAEEQKVIAFLKSDPRMRTVFIGKVAASIANKMFECGMIP